MIDELGGLTELEQDAPSPGCGAGEPRGEPGGEPGGELGGEPGGELGGEPGGEPLSSLALCGEVPDRAHGSVITSVSLHFLLRLSVIHGPELKTSDFRPAPFFAKNHRRSHSSRFHCFISHSELCECQTRC